ncbi:MAG: hypothetical protein AAFX40_02820 [Cyanobacteria bacterium J06639_1]
MKNAAVRATIDAYDPYRDRDVVAYLHDELARRSRWALLYLDLRFFRTYSQFYGFAARQRMLATLGELTVEQLGDECGCYRVGNEAYLAFSTSDRAEADAAAICRRWQEVRNQLYRPKDLVRGYSIGNGRHGTICRYPLVEVSIGLVDGTLRKGEHPDDIANICSVAITTNAMARAQQRSTYFTERQLRQLDPLADVDNVSPGSLDRLRAGGLAIAIEPDAALAFLLQSRLELTGYEVCVATSVRDWVDRPSERIPDIVIVDCEESAARCHELRSLPVFAESLLVALVNDRDRLSVLEAGANIVTPKPFDIDELLYWLQRLRPCPFKSMEFLPNTVHLGISNPTL